MNDIKTFWKLIVAVFVFIAYTGHLQAQQIEKGEMKADIVFLSSDKLKGRETGKPGEKKAARYVVKRFEEIGLEPKGENGSYYQEFTFTARPPKVTGSDSAEVAAKKMKPVTGRNVIGYIDNGKPTTVVIGAHMDHLGMGGYNSLYKGPPAVHNGADDNASGVAMMLQLAEYLMEHDKNNNYLFIAFSGEEKGLWGSNFFMKNPTIDTSTINFMFNFDMVGRLGNDYKLAVYGTGTSPVFDSVLKAANNPVTLHIVKHESGVGSSDHTSFYLKGIPVLHFFTGQHEDYHKPSDDEDKINYDGMYIVLTYVERVLDELNGMGTLEYRKTKDEESRKAMKFSVTLGVIPDYLYEGTGMRIEGTSPGKPAEKSGIKGGDVVIRMGDIEIKDMMSYMKALGKFEKGDKVDVTILRDGKEMVIPVQF